MSRRIRSFNGEPKWQPAGMPSKLDLPPGLMDWMMDRGSLTRQVINACGGRFRVRVIRQQWDRAFPSESDLLGIKPRQRCMLREVQLHCDDTPWVFARTLIPATSLIGAARRLAHLGEKPLGAVLFADRDVRRGMSQFACILPPHELFRHATEGMGQRPDELWGRRTVFHVSGRPLLVNELFLPELPRAC